MQHIQLHVVRTEESPYLILLKKILRVVESPLLFHGHPEPSNKALLYLVSDKSVEPLSLLLQGHFIRLLPTEFIEWATTTLLDVLKRQTKLVSYHLYISLFGRKLSQAQQMEPLPRFIQF